MPSRQQILLMAVLLAAAIALPYVAPTYYVQFASKVMIMGLAAAALNLVVGTAGLVSMCHAAFFGLAGYVLALSSSKYDPSPLLLSLPLAAALAGLAALVIGTLSLRTRGIYFIMVTLAFGEMLFYFFHDTPFSGGSDGAYIYIKPTIEAFGRVWVDLDRVATFYYVALVLLLCGLGLIAMLLGSPFGHALQAARDNERRARALGFPILRLRLTAFVISGALTGIAGYLSAAQFGFIAPQTLGWHHSATILVMVVLGGLRTQSGPLIGAAALMGLEEVLKMTTEHWKLVEGLIVILIVLALPGGVRQLLHTAGMGGSNAAGGRHD